MKAARITKVATTIVIVAPYNTSLIADIKEIPGRRYNGELKAWSVPAEHEDKARAVVRKYFQIEGEESAVEYQIVKVRVSAKVSAKRSYAGGVQVDGYDIIDLMYGNVRSRCDGFEVLEQSGGFVYGDGGIHHGHGHAFKVEYDLTLKVRKGAIFHTTGHADYWGDFEFIKKETEKNA